MNTRVDGVERKLVRGLSAVYLVEVVIEPSVGRPDP
jgi:hypothetical protein